MRFIIRPLPRPILVASAVSISLLWVSASSTAQSVAEPPSKPASAQPAPGTKVHGPERWEKEIAAFEHQDAINPIEKEGILFVGSSSIRLWTDLAKDFPKHRVLNRGFGGSQISDSIYYANRIVVPYAPRMIVMYAGGNDIAAGKTPEQVAGDFRTFVQKVRSKLPEVEIAYISIAGNPSRWKQVERVKSANAQIEAFCKETPRMKFIDVFTHMLGPDGLPKPDIFRDDKLHMNAEGYKIWTAIIGPELGTPDRKE